MKPVKNLCIVQARMGSTRLPGKVLMKLRGKTVLERVLERASAARSVSETMVATGLGRENLPLVRLCAGKGIRVFCGSENDVLDRFYQAAKLIEPLNIIRITADCPLMDPAVIDLVVKAHLRSGADYTSNVAPPTFPDGEDVEVFSFRALERAWKEAELASEREHVTPYIRNHQRLFKKYAVLNEVDLSGKRWTLDRRADLKFISAVYKTAGSGVFGMKEILKIVSKRPELEKLNAGIDRGEGYAKSLREDRRVKCRRP